MIYSKACPKCIGDIVYDRDWWGYFLKCVQCGYTWYGAEPGKRQPERVEAA